MLYSDFGSIEQLVRFADRSNGGNGKVLSFQGDDIDASRSGRKSFGQHKRWDILEDSRKATDETVAADGGKVVNSDAAAQGRIVFDTNVTTEHDRIGHDDSVLDEAIVSYVGVGHKIAIAANGGDPIIFLGAAIDRNAFTKDVCVPDHDLSRRALVRKVLRFATDHTAGKEAIVASDGGMTGQGNAVFQSRAAANSDVGANDAMMTDPNIFIEFGARVDHCGMGDYCWHEKVSERV